MASSRVLAGGIALSLAVVMAACQRSPAPATAPSPPAQVDAARLTNAAADGANWMSTGRTYDEQRHSPLTQVNDGNVAQLALVVEDCALANSRRDEWRAHRHREKHSSD